MKSICMWIAVLSLLGFTSAWANEKTINNVLDKRFTIYGGLHFYQSDGDFRSTREGRPEIELDLDDLNLDKNAVHPTAGAIFNFSKKWTLRLEYFGRHEDSKATADFNFNFDDIIVPVGARIDTNWDLDVYVANLAYNFIHSERARFGVGIGVHAVDLDLKISAKVTVAEEETSFGEGNEDFLAPVPNLYAHGAYAFTDRFLLRFGGGWLSLKSGDFNGSLLVAHAFLEYWPFRYAGFGAGYRYTAIDIEIDDGEKEMEYNGRLPGPELYVTFGF